MDDIGTVKAPTTVAPQAVAVDRVRKIASIASAKAQAVDVTSVVAPAVRGPVKVDAPVGPSVGPRQVAVTDGVPTMGTASFEIGGEGSSVQEGIVTDRDVIGSAEGAQVVNVQTSVADGFHGAGGFGTGLGRNL